MSNTTDRRSFLKASGLALAGAAVLPHLTWAADDSSSDKLTADLGKVADLDSGSPVYVDAQFRDGSDKVVDEQKLYVRAVKDGNGGLNWVVLSAICTHLKCKLKYKDGDDHFECPCHHSVFDLEGHVLKKPAKKDLPDYSSSVCEQNGRLVLTKPA